MSEETATKKNVYISLHEGFVRENIQYTDKQTGEQRTFNRVTLPKGTFIDGKDVGGYEFSPLYVNPSKFRGENWRDIPLLAEREVWLQRGVRDEGGSRLGGEDGRRAEDTVDVAPKQIKDALAESRKRYAEEHGVGLDERAQHAREASESIEREGASARPLSLEAR